MPEDTVPTPPFPAVKDETPMIIYILYLGGFVFALTSLVGVIMAYVNRNGAAPWAQTHYTFQIRTFWIGLFYLFVSLLCCFILIGFVMMLLVAIWLIIRCAKGIKLSSAAQPYPNVTSWLW
jgi:uncharacterized membrane protein